MKKYVSIANLKATVKSENGVETVFINYNVDNTFVRPIYNKDELVKKMEVIYSEIVKLGCKENYTDEESILINSFYSFSIALNFIQVNVAPLMKTSTAIVDAISNYAYEYYRNYGAGFEDVYFPVLFGKQTMVIDGENQCSIVMKIKSLDNFEMRKLIQYMSKCTLRNCCFAVARIVHKNK